jgi:anti-anti-sigma regulatory factor
MSPNNHSQPTLTAADRQAFKLFWEIYDSHYDQISEASRREIADHPEFGPLLKGMSAEHLAEQGRHSRQMLRRALLDNEWQAYLEELQTQGAAYAHGAISFASWFEVLSLWRAHLIPLLFEAYAKTPAKLRSALNGMNRFLEIAMAGIGEAYLQTKENLIRDQQSAIRELSTPVLQVREGLLILPIIGVLDSHRARQLTQDLLQAIRAQRAKMVVMDITGVPVVDTQVANHLLQTVEAARLMGADIILTGLSPEIAQTVVRLGVNLRTVNTMGDLQQGIDEAERRLGYRVAKIARPVRPVEADEE